jgi:hypothetical protein
MNDDRKPGFYKIRFKANPLWEISFWGDPNFTDEPKWFRCASEKGFEDADVAEIGEKVPCE